MRQRLAILVLGIACVAPLAAHAQSPGDATLYCTPSGGPLGAATDAEHDVQVGDPPLPRGVQRSRVTIGGVSTRVLQSGPRHAHWAIVFVHGNPGSSRDFDALQAAGGRFARTVAFDVPGFGRSQRAPDNGKFQTLDGAAAYTQDVMTKLGVRRAVLVLHDFGGPWGLQWARFHKQAFRGAYLLNTGVLVDYIPHPLAVIWSTQGAGELEMAGTTRQSFVTGVQATEPHPLPDRFVQLMYDYYDRAERCAILRYYRDAAKTYQTWPRAQANALRPLDRPALVVWGDRDVFIPPDQAEKQRQAFPHARIVHVPDGGHWIHIDHPRLVRSLFTRFLRPRLKLVRPIGVQPRNRKMLVRVKVKGVLPAYGVVVRLRRHRRTVGSTGRPTPVTVTRVLTIRLAKPLRAGRYTLRVSGRGVAPRMLRLRVMESAGRGA